VTAQDVENDPELSERDIGTKKTKDFNNETKYIVRDHWFRVSLKLRWDDAPVKPDEDKDKDRG